MSFRPRVRNNNGAYTTPFSNTGVEFFPLGVVPDYSGLVLHESGYLPHNENWNFPNIFSPFWRLIYDGGPGHTIVFPDREVPLGPDRIVILPDHRRCHFREDAPAPTFWLHFNCSRSPVLHQPVPIELTPTPVELGLIGELRPLYKRAGHDETRQRIFRLSLALVQVALSRSEIRWMREKPEPLLKVVHHIDANFREPLYNRDLARMAGLCGTKFRRCQGVTPAQYIAQVRVREAGQLLAHSDLSVDQIAEMSGFPNRSYFSRVFKRVTGESPAGFRLNHAPRLAA